MHIIAASASVAAPISIVAILIGLPLVIFNVWIAVIAIQFFRTGTQAFRRYLLMTSVPQQGPPQQGPSSAHSRQPTDYH